MGPIEPEHFPSEAGTIILGVESENGQIWILGTKYSSNMSDYFNHVNIEDRDYSEEEKERLIKEKREKYSNTSKLIEAWNPGKWSDKHIQDSIDRKSQAAKYVRLFWWKSMSDGTKVSYLDTAPLCDTLVMNQPSI